MSLSRLLLNTLKRDINIRVYDLTVDGTLTGIGDIPISSIQSSGTIGFLHDDGANVSVKDIEITDLQNIGAGAVNGTFLRYDSGVVSFEPVPSGGDNIYDNDGTLVSNRTVDGGTFNLAFNNINDLSLISTNSLTVQSPSLSLDGTTAVFLSGDNLTFNPAPPLNATITKILGMDSSDRLRYINAGSISDTSIYTNNGSLTGNRTVDQNTFPLNFQDGDFTVSNGSGDTGVITKTDSTAQLLVLQGSNQNEVLCNQTNIDIRSRNGSIDERIRLTAATGTEIQSQKITLTNTPAVDNTLTEILARDSGTGELKYRDVSTIGSGGGSSFARRIVVAQSGGDYTDIGSALTAASALIPTFNDRVLIQVYAGTYNLGVGETLTVPDYVNIFGSDQTYIQRTSASADPLIVLGAYSILKGVIINLGNNSSSSGTGCVNFAGDRSGMLNCTIYSTNQVQCCVLNNANHFLIQTRFLMSPTTALITRAVEVNSGIASAENMVFDACIFRQTNVFTTNSSGIICDGNLGNYRINNCIFQNLSTDVGSDGAIRAAGNGAVSITGCLFRSCGIALEIAQANNYVHSCDFIGSTIYDIDIATGAFAYISGCSYDPTLINNGSGGLGAMNLVGIDNNGGTGYNFVCDEGITMNNIPTDNSTTNILGLDTNNQVVIKNNIFTPEGYSGYLGSPNPSIPNTGLLTVLKYTSFSVGGFDFSGYNPTTGIYTVPRDGFYSISASCVCKLTSGSAGTPVQYDINFEIRYNGNIAKVSSYTHILSYSTSDLYTVNADCIVNCAGGTQIEIGIEATSTGTLEAQGSTEPEKSRLDILRIMN